MTLEELQQSVNKDFKLDDTELDAESIKIPLLHNKYLQHFNKFSLLLKKSEYDHKIMLRNKWEYYTGKADPSVYQEKPFDIKVLKADVHIYMDSDPDLQKADQKDAYLNQKVMPIKTHWQPDLTIQMKHIIGSYNIRTHLTSFLIHNSIR